MFKASIDYIIVGLGNVGSGYNMTRHNMGFMVLDEIAERWNFKFNKNKFQSSVSNVKLLDKKLLFMKPETYMNNSGLAVAQAVNYYKVQMQNIIVVYDDITLDLGKIKIKKQGSSGGHNGLKSIIELTDSELFPRVKVGISAKPSKDYKLADWVLSRFKDEEMQNLKQGLLLASDAVETIIKYNVDVAMNKFN